MLYFQAFDSFLCLTKFSSKLFSRIFIQLLCSLAPKFASLHIFQINVCILISFIILLSMFMMVKSHPSSGNSYISGFLGLILLIYFCSFDWTISFIFVCLEALRWDEHKWKHNISPCVYTLASSKERPSPVSLTTLGVFSQIFWVNAFSLALWV